MISRENFEIYENLNDLVRIVSIPLVPSVAPAIHVGATISKSQTDSDCLHSVQFGIQLELQNRSILTSRLPQSSKILWQAR